MRMLALVVSICFAINSSLCAQPAPPDIKSGAWFVWNMLHSENIKELERKEREIESSNLKIDLTPEGEEAIEKIFKLASKLVGDLDREVDFVDSRYIKGEQYAIFAINSETHGLHFFELHMLGRTRPLRITEVKQLTFDEVYKMTRLKKQAVSIPIDN